jgi:hypothetical protein
LARSDEFFAEGGKDGAGTHVPLVTALLSRLSLWLPAALLLLAFVWLAYWMPIGVDSGVYLYIGQVVASGGLPYVDAWDHKGPLLYLFNAAGILTGAGGIRGVVLLEGALVTFSLLVCTHIWKTLSGVPPALLVAFGFAFSYLAMFEHGNFTETWLTPFSLLAYTLAARDLASDARPTYRRLCATAFVLGLAGAVAGFTRINNGAGLFTAAVALLLFFRLSALPIVIGLLAGFAAVAVPLLVYLGAGGIGAPAFEQYVLFNLSYSSMLGLREKAEGALNLIQILALSPLAALLMIGAGMRIVCTVAPRRSATALVLFLIASIDLASQMLSGFGFPHYAVVALPALAVSCVLLAPVPRDRQGSWAISHLLFATIIAFGFTTGVVRSGAALAQARIMGLRNPQSALNDLAELVVSWTGPDDSILQLGGDTAVLAATARRSATTMSYVGPLSQPFFALRPEATTTFAQEVMAAGPSLILRPAENCEGGTSCRDAAELLPPSLRTWVAEHYEPVATLHGREVLRRREDAKGRW